MNQPFLHFFFFVCKDKMLKKTKRQNKLNEIILTRNNMENAIMKKNDETRKMVLLKVKMQAE